MAKEEATTQEPIPGTICPWAREASLKSGKGLVKDAILCIPECAMFGIYYADGRLEKAVGCRRKT